MLFNHLSLRTGKKATILTNRLCHKSYLVNITGMSYRIKETKKNINKKQCVINFLYL